jgi:carbonic anhydrase
MRLVRSFLLAICVAISMGAAALAQNSQSPINIFKPVHVELPELDFTYSNAATLNVVDMVHGHLEIQATPDAGDGILELSGDTYQLKQFHFHTLSEHTLKGTRYPMEMHLVHERLDEDGDLTGELLVVGRWIEPTISLGLRHVELDKIWPPKASPLNVLNFDLTTLLPADLSSYRYDGSLTTGNAVPYQEGVQWVMLADIMQISHDQIDDFQDLFPGGNFRGLQELNGRIILTDVVPEPSTLWLLGVAVVVLGRSRKG